MTSTDLAPAPSQPIQGRLSQPPATANAAQSAHYRIGNVLKELIHASPHAFTSENEQLAANKAVDDFVAAMVPNSAQRALADIPTRAPVEDVSQRVPAGLPQYALPNNTQAIDYDKLAAAIVRAQAAHEEANAESPAAETPAPQQPAAYPPADAPAGQAYNG